VTHIFRTILLRHRHHHPRRRQGHRRSAVPAGSPLPLLEGAGQRLQGLERN